MLSTWAWRGIIGEGVGATGMALKVEGTLKLSFNRSFHFLHWSGLECPRSKVLSRRWEWDDDLLPPPCARGSEKWSEQKSKWVA